MKKKGLLKFKQIIQTWLYFPCGLYIIQEAYVRSRMRQRSAVPAELFLFCFTSFFICFFIKKEKRMKEYDLAVCCCLPFKLDRVYSHIVTSRVRRRRSYYCWPLRIAFLPSDLHKSLFLDSPFHLHHVHMCYLMQRWHHFLSYPHFFFHFILAKESSQVSVGFTGNFTILLIIPQENDNDICGSLSLYMYHLYLILANYYEKQVIKVSHITHTAEK